MVIKEYELFKQVKKMDYIKQGAENSNEDLLTLVNSAVRDSVNVHDYISVKLPLYAARFDDIIFQNIQKEYDFKNFIRYYDPYNISISVDLLESKW